MVTQERHMEPPVESDKPAPLATTQRASRTWNPAVNREALIKIPIGGIAIDASTIEDAH